MLGRTIRKPWAELSALRERTQITLELRGDAALQRGGRTARVQEWASQGLIDQTTAQEALLSTPDVRKASRDALSPVRLVEWQIRRVIENPDDWFDAQPNKDTPLAIAVERSARMIQRAMVEGADPETITQLQAYRGQAERLLREQTAPAPVEQEIPLE